MNNFVETQGNLKPLTNGRGNEETDTAVEHLGCKDMVIQPIKARYDNAIKLITNVAKQLL